jgi:hypothetical protein
MATTLTKEQEAVLVEEIKPEFIGFLMNEEDFDIQLYIYPDGREVVDVWRWDDGTGGAGRKMSVLEFIGENGDGPYWKHAITQLKAEHQAGQHEGPELSEGELAVIEANYQKSQAAA